MERMNKKTIRIFDAHCDTASALWETGGSLRKNCGHVDLSRAAEYGGYLQFFAIFTEFPDYHEKYLRILDYLKRQLAENADLVSFCKTGEDADLAAEQGKAAAFFTVEGAELLNCDIGELEKAQEAGLAAVNLTWNHANALAGSNAERPEQGLTDQGRDFVRCCERLGVLVDVSHLSDPGFWDVIEMAEKPMIASHSDSRALCAHPRNLTDKQFQALCGTGGVVGINLFSLFLGEKPTVRTAVDHMEHFLELGGERHLGLGADFDGCNALPEGISGIQSMDAVYEEMLRRNFSRETADNIFFGNFRRILSQIKRGSI